jgi:guanine nucleotide-binding protein subunit alpha
MGCTGSKIDPQEKEASQRNARIERQLRQDKKAESRTVKILLLGRWSGACGLNANTDMK